MGPLEAMVFLDASCYFWTRRGISARVHNERAAGRAGGRTGWQSYFWTRLRAGGRADKVPKLFLDTFPGGRAGGQAGKIISGHVPGRAGGRTGWQSYFWTRSRAGGRADRLAKLFLDTFPGGRAGGRTGWQSYFWTRSRAGGRADRLANYFWTRSRAGGRADRLAKLFLDTFPGGRAGGQAGKVISGHVFKRIISGHLSGRAAGRADRLAKLILDTFPGGRADRLAKLFLESCRLKNWRGLARNVRFGSLSLEKLEKPRTKRSFWKLVA